MNYEPYLEISARSIAVYFFIILALRLFGKKELSQLSVIDLVFILLISNSVQNAMVGDNVSLEGGITAALSLFIVNYSLKKVLYKSKKISDLIQGKPVVLIYDGNVIQQNLEDASITIEELSSAVREHGIIDPGHVFLGMLEVDGTISIISGSLDNRTTYTVKGHRLAKNLNMKNKA